MTFRGFYYYKLNVRKKHHISGLLRPDDVIICNKIHNQMLIRFKFHSWPIPNIADAKCRHAHLRANQRPHEALHITLGVWEEAVWSDTPSSEDRQHDQETTKRSCRGWQEQKKGKNSGIILLTHLIVLQLFSS